MTDKNTFGSKDVMLFSELEVDGGGSSIEVCSLD